MFYLNDDFNGGETVFKIGRREDDNYYTVKPKTGSVLFFMHRQLHTGSVVTRGTKYVLRTDVMYAN